MQLGVTDITEIHSLRNVKRYAASDHGCLYTKSLKSCF